MPERDGDGAAARTALAARFALLAGLGLGLAAGSRMSPPPSALWACGGVALLVALGRRHARSAIAALALLAALGGVGIAQERLLALDARALEAAPGTSISAVGYLLTPPRPGTMGFGYELQTSAGRIAAVSAFDPQAKVGEELEVSGTIRAPADFERERLREHGIAAVLEAERAERTGRRRLGLAGALDMVRRNAEDALDAAGKSPSSALLRGFVLGEDERIPEPVREEFKRSGLSHILAVSGQNVILLALLAAPVLGLAGMPRRARLLALIGLIAIYVPVAGGGPSIVRAGIMGVAGLLATLADRPSSRWYALLLAADLTLALNPRYLTDVGWELSFAAVLGILLLAGPLRDAMLPATVRAGPARRALADGAAITIAATLATAPLIAARFEVVSLTTLPANLLAAPAVAPAMWAGMAGGALGQVPGAPAEPLGLLGGLCAGFIGWVAHALGARGAQIQIAAPGVPELIGIYAAAALASWLALAALRRRGGIRALALPRVGGASRAARPGALIAAALLVAGTLVLRLGADGTPATGRGLRIDVLDVGQGDAILARLPGGRSLLVDTGPPGDDVSARLVELGVHRLAALAITHDQSDHAGELRTVLTQPGADRLIYGAGSPPALCARSACPRLRPVTRGEEVRLGRLRLSVLWPPPPARFPVAEQDPNTRSLVMLMHWGRFSMLLTGDAEQELAPVDPGPVDVLKVAHHGSADAGLAELLKRAEPSLAVISVGRSNPYGHPTSQTLAELRGERIPVLRTDLDGEIAIEVHAGRWRLR